MNKRLFTIALLISTLPIFSQAQSLGVHFNEGDFKVTPSHSPIDDSDMHLKLSKSGKAKIKKLANLGVSSLQEIDEVLKK